MNIYIFENKKKKSVEQQNFHQNSEPVYIR